MSMGTSGRNGGTRGRGSPPLWHRRDREEIKVEGRATGRERGALKKPERRGARLRGKRLKRRGRPASGVGVEVPRPKGPGPWMRKVPARPAVKRQRAALSGRTAPAASATPQWIAGAEERARAADGPIERRFLFVDVVISGGPVWKRPPRPSTAKASGARPAGAVEGRKPPRPKPAVPLRGRRPPRRV